jgi:SET domain-containing protein
MLLVETYIDRSQIHGVGLYAKEPIKKGAVIWQFKDGFDQKFSVEEIEKLPLAAQHQILHYGYLSKEAPVYILCADNARFFNHSANPNVIDDAKEEGLVLAARDIRQDEELTCDYWAFDDDTDQKLMNSRAI